MHFAVLTRVHVERYKRLEWLISKYVNRDSDAVRFEAKETAAAAAAAAVQTRASRPLGSFLQNCASTKLALDVLRSCAELALKSISCALQRFAESS